MADTKAILGISSGTRSIGLAMMRNGDLVDWKVKTFKGEWSKDKLEYILRQLDAICRYYSVTAIALKKVDPSKGSRQLEVLTAGIIKLARRKRIPIDTYTIHDLHSVADGRYRSAKKSIAEFVLDTYPTLRREYLRERNNKREYYTKMFEAVVCAHIRNEKEADI